jgi:hypothetical protein
VEAAGCSDVIYYSLCQRRMTFTCLDVWTLDTPYTIIITTHNPSVQDVVVRTNLSIDLAFYINTPPLFRLPDLEHDLNSSKKSYAGHKKEQQPYRY